MNSRSPADSHPIVALDFLTGVPLLTGLQHGALEELSGLMKYRAFGTGMTLFHQDMPGTTLYLIADGYVRMYAIGQTGQEFTYHIYGPAEVFGELSLLDDGIHPATCVTMTPIKTWLLSKDNLFMVLRKYPELMLRMLGMIAHRARAATQKSEAMAFQDVQGRLAYEMLNLGAHNSVRTDEGILIEVPLTQHDLASMVGATRESVNKALAMFKAQDLIRISGTSITVVEPHELERIIAERGR
jgi:CRP/FNR family transcriptional regulator, cyclic AMP receptor protein